MDAQVSIDFHSLPLKPELAFIVTNLFDSRGVTTSYSGVFWNQVTYIQPSPFSLRVSGSF